MLKKGLHVTLVAYGTMLDAKVSPLLAMRNSTVMKSSAICGNPNSATAFDLHGVDWPDISHLHSTHSCSTPTDSNFKPCHASTPTRLNKDNNKDNKDNKDFIQPIYTGIYIGDLQHIKHIENMN